MTPESRVLTNRIAPQRNRASDAGDYLAQDTERVFQRLCLLGPLPDHHTFRLVDWVLFDILKLSTGGYIFTHSSYSRRALLLYSRLAPLRPSLLPSATRSRCDSHAPVCSSSLAAALLL
jgi:hypothetical protein